VGWVGLPMPIEISIGIGNSIDLVG